MGFWVSLSYHRSTHLQDHQSHLPHQSLFYLSHFYLRRKIRVDKLINFRTELNEAFNPNNRKISINDIIIKSVTPVNDMEEGKNIFNHLANTHKKHSLTEKMNDVTWKKVFVGMRKRSTDKMFGMCAKKFSNQNLNETHATLF